MIKKKTKQLQDIGAAESGKTKGLKMKKSGLRKIIREAIKSVLKEFTRRNFDPPKESNPKEALKYLIDWGFKKTAKTNRAAIKRINQYKGDTMFVHIQYHELKKPDGSEIRLHQSQFYNREKPSVNTTMVQVQDMSGPEGTSARAVGDALVATDVFLAELTKQKGFKITKRAS